MSDIPKIPTYRELQDKLKDLENENEILGRRYADLCRTIKKQGKNKVDDGDKFLRNYAKGWGRL